ncbi:zwei Ig domain protein zig-8 isoform X2 [Eurytemora carolleeae]|nr:zwei Ig domain protein zig-8 isoform X2 [Eurytemora carolleeae]|eukprot:XP_023345142.1 zwei Ig domain protein zig-8-like isoform X2 [Eurytemora affinis]
MLVFVTVLLSVCLSPTAQLKMLDKTQEPFFDVTANSVFTGQVGGRVFLSCAIYNLHNKSVSWIRERDGYILTVDRETFISDSRFFAVHSDTGLSDTWSLGINHVEDEDQGKYQCQVSAEEKLSRITELVVIHPQVTIQGGPDIHVKARSVVHLKCIISQTVDPPVYVTWFFNNKMLIDFTGADVSLSHSLTVSTSRLTLRDVDLVDAGNYTCQPAALPEATVTLHVVKPETVEIMEVTSAAETLMSLTALSLFSFIFYFI